MAFVPPGFEFSTTGKSGTAFIDDAAPTFISLSQADATTFWVNGYGLAISATYETYEVP